MYFWLSTLKPNYDFITVSFPIIGQCSPVETMLAFHTQIPICTWRELFYAILYKGLEHPRIVVPEGDPGTNPLLIPRNYCII